MGCKAAVVCGKTSQKILELGEKKIRVVRGKMGLGKMGHFVMPSKAQTKNITKRQRKMRLYDPMLRLYIKCDWAWKKTSKIKQKITI